MIGVDRHAVGGGHRPAVATDQVPLEEGLAGESVSDAQRFDGVGGGDDAADEAGAEVLRKRVGDRVKICVGDAGLEAVATYPSDLVIAGLVGAVGLAPTLAAIRAGRDIALANKEVLVMAGALVRRAVEEQGVELLPVDSEHSAIFQALAGQRAEDMARIILTASGGPFRTWDTERIASAWG